MNRRDFFNINAESWDDNPDLLTTEKIKKTILPLLKIKNTDSVLDAACGTGILIQTFKEQKIKASLCAVDFAEKMINKAKQKFPDVNFILADVSCMPFENETFTKVVSLNSFPHFEDKNRAVKEMARVLKKNGTLIIAHTNSKCRIDAHHRKIGGIIAEDMLPSNDNLREILSESGFSNIEFTDNEEFYIVKASK